MRTPSNTFSWCLASCLLISAEVGAASLVPGGHLLAPMDGEAAGGRASWAAGGFGQSPAGLLQSDGGTDLRMSFTPRGGVSVLLREQDQARNALRGDIVVGDRFGSLAIADGGEAVSPAQQANLQAVSPLSIGGAVSWSSWTLGGAYARGQFIGGATDMVGASIGFGSVRARIGYGVDSNTRAREGGELWVLGTDLAASPWLTLEGDLALSTPAGAVEPATVGRVGVRLTSDHAADLAFAEGCAKFPPTSGSGQRSYDEIGQWG